MDDLPDDILLIIFDFYVFKHQDQLINLMLRAGMKRKIESWRSLVHVCRRWRGLVFRSPRRLNLQLCCYTPRICAREILDVWPALPLVILGGFCEESVDYAIAELEPSDRITQINLMCHTATLPQQALQSKKLWTALQVPFPELTALSLTLEISLGCRSYTPPLDDSFLGGSAPRLRYFLLNNIPFPGLPKLLLSASHLASLHLYGIPHSRYISPEAMVTLLSVLSGLETLSLGFQSPQSRPDLESRSLPPLKRSILPVLYEFYFKGVTEYLEELVTHIDTPQLDGMNITSFNQIDFDFTRLVRFINCTPTLRTRDKAYVQFDDSSASVKFR